MELCHDVLRCQSVKHKREIYHNRDKNAVKNMLSIVKSIFDTGQRPKAFCRSSEDFIPLGTAVVLTTAVNPNFGSHIDKNKNTVSL